MATDAGTKKTARSLGHRPLRAGPGTAAAAPRAVRGPAGQHRPPRRPGADPRRWRRPGPAASSTATIASGSPTNSGYECPEIVKDGLTDQEKRTLARALNLARRQLDQARSGQIIADQLRETPGRSNRWVGKQLGVHHATVAAVRSGLEGTGQIIQLRADARGRRQVPPAARSAEEEAPSRATHPTPDARPSSTPPTEVPVRAPKPSRPSTARRPNDWLGSGPRP